MIVNIHRENKHGAWNPETYTAAVNQPITVQHNGTVLATITLRGVSFTHNYRKAILRIEVTNGR